MKRSPFLASILVLALAACSSSDREDAPSGEKEESADLRGSYDIDPQSGVINATHTDAAGVTTTMRAGENVEAPLPEPFTLYPAAEVTSTTHVKQGEGQFLTIEFTTPDTRDAVVDFYREQAREAGIAPDIEVSAGATTTLGGESAGRRTSFALQVTRVSALTEGQLSISDGLD